MVQVCSRISRIKQKDFLPKRVHKDFLPNLILDSTSVFSIKTNRQKDFLPNLHVVKGCLQVNSIKKRGSTHFNRTREFFAKC